MKSSSHGSETNLRRTSSLFDCKTDDSVKVRSEGKLNTNNLKEVEDMTANQIAYWNLRENERTHKENESIGRTNAGANVLSATANRKNAETRASELGETIRHNKVQEGIGIANAVTGGIANVGKGVGSVAKIFI